MPRGLLIHRIDQIKRMPGEMALVGVWIHPDGKKLRAQVSAPCLVEADVANIFGIGRPEIEALVQKPLRRIGMRVDDERGIVNLLGSRADHDVRLGRFVWGLGCSKGRDKRKNQRKTEQESVCHKGMPANLQLQGSPRLYRDICRATKPRSGERMQPTAQAVGDEREIASPGGAKEKHR